MGAVFTPYFEDSISSVFYKRGVTSTRIQPCLDQAPPSFCQKTPPLISIVIPAFDDGVFLETICEEGQIKILKICIYFELYFIFHSTNFGTRGCRVVFELTKIIPCQSVI